MAGGNVMRYKNLLVFLLFFSPLYALSLDQELQKLCDIVRSLKTQGEEGFKDAQKILMTDPLWTPMNELVATDPTSECKASDRVPGFKLNKLLAGAEQAQRFETSTGNMLNGEDARFNYSLYERTVRSGATVEYNLSGRSGEQTFIIIPFEADADFTATVKAGEEPMEVKKYKDGTLAFTGNVSKGERVKLTIINTSDRNCSFAILNHNTRR